MEPKDFSLLEQAYKNVYAEGAEEYSGGQHPSKSPNKADRDRYETERRRSEAPKGVGVPDKKTGYGQLKQDVDMFELVKGHLMSEGYADSEKAALAIMANMSEGWRQSIVEQIPAGEYVRRGGDPQHMGRDLPSSKGGTSKPKPASAADKKGPASPGGAPIRPSASDYARRGGDPQHMGRDLPPSKGGTSKLVVPPNVRRYAGGG